MVAGPTGTSRLRDDGLISFALSGRRFAKPREHDLVITAVV